jgi:hypothetical protein
MNRLRLRLPPWTTHPGFGVIVLFALAVLLIAHGEPQPSSRPSGTSVGVSGTATATGAVPPLLYLRAGQVELRQQRAVRRIPLPAGAVPRAIVSGRGLAVVLAAVDGHQRAYAVDHSLRMHDLGYADAVFPAASGAAAVLVETSALDPGLLALPTPSPSGSTSRAGASTGTSSKANPGQPELRDYVVRRYDPAGRLVGGLQELPPRTRVATDTPVGLVVWQPVNRVFDAGVAQESLSAAAELLRPDGTQRQLGPVHPLAANGQNLLVWDVSARRFGVMPLRYVTSTATSTATPSATGSTTSSSDSPGATPRPTTVAGTRWFLPTRGMLLVTGPAAFNADGSAFAVYAQVGTRRRLVVAELQNLGTDQVQVLALAQPPVKPTATPSGSVSLVSPSNGASTRPDSRSATASVPALQPDGYPITAPLAPLWWNGLVVGVGTDGTVIGYKPGGVQSSLLDLGLTQLSAVATAP